jgi:GT2 family glycosyltransferase/glycosyltransferase involved in cell wall biosynthesis/polysaccharide pyruvyl transferase WcaK-like protein
VVVVAHFGTFDIENYGDLLFPLILERRLSDLGHAFVHVSPHGGPPVWDDCVPTVAAEAIITDPPDLAGVIVGGGHIIHASRTSLDRYDQGGLSTLVAYPSLWLGAAYAAVQQNVPYCWNAPGVSQPFSPVAARLVEWATSSADYLAVRDRLSHSRLVEAGISRLIRVVPDTALEISRIWSTEQLEAAFVELFASRGRAIPPRVIAIHLNQRYVGADFTHLANILDQFAERLAATPILIAMGPCHGDDQLQRAVADLMTSQPLVIERPHSLRQIAACIARAEAYIGSSLHGMITACSFGTRGMVVVPRSAGTLGKFSGFLEPFQLTQWLAETWEEAEQRFNDFIDSPREPWTRVLDVALPILDDHWNRVRSLLDLSSSTQQHPAGPVPKQGAIDRLMAINGSASVNTLLFGSLIAEQAANANQFRTASNEAHRAIDKALSAQSRLQSENGELHAAIERAEKALDELGKDRDLLREQLSDARAEATRLQQERATEDEAQLAQFQSAADALISRQDELMDAILETAQGLLRIDAHLAKLGDRPQSKKDAALLASAQRELLQVRNFLSSGPWLAEDVQPSTHRRSAPPLVANRLLPARSAEETAALRPRNGAEDSLSSELPSTTDHATLAAGAVREPDGAVGRRIAADVVICVHDALDDVQRCLDSVVRNTSARHHLIIVDDGSDEECASFLREFSEGWPQITLLRNEQPRGYTKSANQGLRQASSNLVVMLNSDSIVPYRWLERLIECAESDAQIGLVGPLSNAASYQSVPERIDPSGDWATNPIPPGWDVDQVAAGLETISNRAFPRVPFLNGFCLVIKRAVIDAIGYFDEERFPQGFGEENDYCLRAAAAGFDLAIADHAYVYHAKSRSYSHERRRELGKTGQSVLLQHFGAERITSAESLIRNNAVLASMRLEFGALLKSLRPVTQPVKVLFLLPVSGGGGGAHSVVQEVAGMHRLGVEAQIAVRPQHLSLYRDRYADLANEGEFFFAYNTPKQLHAHASHFTVVVATIHTSVPLLNEIIAKHPWLIPAYYIQDYEPYFFPDDSPSRLEAARSYTLIEDAVPFAKTRWLCETVQRHHGIKVRKVEASLDHDVFFPPLIARQDTPLNVMAMIRPRSPRRGAARTIEVLRDLSREFEQQIDIHFFGASRPELKDSGLIFDFPCTDHGVLAREQVAQLLRDSHIFLDLSDYQAFGRTGLEAMACGCAVVVPALGGATEYAVDRENALVVDTKDLESCLDAVRQLVSDEALREQLRLAGQETARHYTIEGAARSEIELFSHVLAARRPTFVQANREDDRIFASASPP